MLSFSPSLAHTNESGTPMNPDLEGGCLKNLVKNYTFYDIQTDYMFSFLEGLSSFLHEISFSTRYVGKTKILACSHCCLCG